MSILINKNTKVLIQGMTGREASVVSKEMIDYGTNVVCGVTPGKGTQTLHNVPIYDTVSEAVCNHNPDATLVYVPPFAVKDAVMESLANDIKLVNIITERVPVHDTLSFLREAKKQNARIIGPTSLGILSAEEAKIGAIGGNTPEKVYKKGGIAILSKSGGMTNETAWIIRQAGFGQSTCVGLGGDALAGTIFSDLFELYEKDKQTKALVLFGELGGTYEEQAAQAIIDGVLTKPVIAFVTGMFSELMPSTQFGHAGAIIRGNTGSPKHKIAMFKKAGVRVADVHHQIPELLKEVL